MSSYAIYPSLQGRAVLISGGATGIGETLVRRFAEQGARVGFIDIAVAEGQALAAQLNEAGHTVAFVAADITDIAALRAAIDALRAQLGPFRALLNNAANDQRQTLESITPELWDAGIAVNLRHQFFAAQALLPDMRAQGGGAIVNFGSVSWMLRQGNLPVYTASKAAVHGMSRSMARDLGPDRIRVNTLVPGWVMTEKQLRHRVDEAAKAEIAKGQCIPAAVMPDDVARLALFLCADDSAMCTAQVYVVDGGWV